MPTNTDDFYTSVNCTEYPAVCEHERKLVILILGIFCVVSFTITGGTLIFMLYYRLYKNVRTRLVMYLLLSDFIQAIAISLVLCFYAFPPYIGELACLVMGWMGVFSNNALSWWSAAIAIFLVITIYSPNNLAKKLFIFEILCQLIWLYAIIAASYGLIAYPANYFYVPVSDGAWCWISINYPVYRVLLQYGIIALVMCFLFGVYISIALYLNCRPSEGNSDVKKRVMQLIGFPTTYFLAFFPLTIIRLVNVFMNLPIEAAYVTVFFEPLDGIFNVIWYGYTRQIFKKAKEEEMRKKKDLGISVSLLLENDDHPQSFFPRDHKRESESLPSIEE